MTPLAFEVPGPPVPWARTAYTPQGKRVTPVRYRKYKAHLTGRMHLATASHAHKWPVDLRYFVLVRAWFTNRNVRDIDNVVKAVLDAGNGRLWQDDSQVVAELGVKVLGAADAKLEVRVAVVDELSDWVVSDGLGCILGRIAEAGSGRDVSSDA